MMKRYFMIMVVTIAVMFGFKFESYAECSDWENDIMYIYDWDDITEEEFKENLYLIYLVDHGCAAIYVRYNQTVLFNGSIEDFERWCNVTGISIKV